MCSTVQFKEICRITRMYVDSNNDKSFKRVLARAAWILDNDDSIEWEGDAVQEALNQLFNEDDERKYG